MLKSLLLAGFLLLGACTSKKDLKKMLKEDPSILTEAIEANPDKFIEAMTNAVQKAKVAKAK